MDQNDIQLIEGTGAFYPQDFSFKTLNLVLANGRKFELRKLLVDFSYYEDIYTFTTSGYVSVIDAQGFIETLQITGNEFIEVNFGKVKNAPNETDKLFRVYKVGNRTNSGNMNSEGYTIHFCSEELLLSEQIKISKGYVGKKISEIVTDVLKNNLKVPANRINRIESTTGMYDFQIPKMKPFEAISWVSTYARPAMNSKFTDMLFFETKDGFNFRSLQSMYKDEIYNTYKYEPKNLNNKTQNFEEKIVTVLEYEFSKPFDALKEIQSGTFANRLVSIDPLTRSFNVTDFDFSKIESQLQKLNDNPTLKELENRLGKMTTENVEGVLKVATGNSNESFVDYIRQKEGGIAKDIFIETYVTTRTAMLSLANFTVMKAIIPGDPGITAGRTIQFNLYTLKPTDKTKALDRFYSGKYLVTAVRHIIQNTKYETVLELAKESITGKYDQINNNSTSIKEAIST